MIWVTIFKSNFEIFANFCLTGGRILSNFFIFNSLLENYKRKNEFKEVPFIFQHDGTSSNLKQKQKSL